MAAEACALLLLVALAQAPAPPPETEPPSEELLLHLAEFGDADDRYVDPLELDRASEADAKRSRANDDTAPNDDKAPIDDTNPDEPPR